ncbi:MAG: peptidylprolyl isomerase [Rhodocyclales bacterium]|nr:peptidylprolyl isomerase [Rhodocyclales bacterium]
MDRGIVVLIAALSGSFALAPSVRAEDAPPPAAVFATVDGKPISQQDFHSAFANFLRQKYYHGQVPEGQLALAREEVKERLVDRLLLLAEASRRGLVADEKHIDAKIAEYDARYATSPVWQQRRETLLPGLRLQLGEQDILSRIEEQVRTLPELTDAQVQEFYQTRPELFTEPEKMRLHTILLKVEPSSPAALWDAARAEAQRIVARLRADGKAFEELARLHSQDRNADKGGDMGYVHRGMIPEAVQAQIDAHELGSVGDPIDVLEGVAIFRLDERLPSRVMAYADVAARARDLLKRERSNQAWDGFVAGLRKTAVVKMAEPAAPVPAATTN